MATNDDAEQVIDTDFEVVREEVVREAEVVTRKRGRPLHLTPARFEKICKLIEEGATNVSACKQMLVSFTHFRNIVNANEEYQTRSREAVKIREEVWRDHALEMVKNAMPKNWIAAMSYLERKFPSEFSLRNVVRTEAGDAKLIGDKISDADLRRYAELNYNFQKENQAPAEEGTQPENLRSE